MNFTESIHIHDLIDMVNTVLDARDPYTFSHSWRVTELSVLIALSMQIDEKMIKKIHVAAHLHDIGKIGVSDHILNKSGALTVEEMRLMKAHARIGFNILQRQPIFSEISQIVLYHHERFDGKGYPAAISGKEIPLGSRIIAVADAFDALTSDRPYRKALGYEYAFDEIQKCSSSQFCPDVVGGLMKVKDHVPESMEKVDEETFHSAFDGEESIIHTR